MFGKSKSRKSNNASRKRSHDRRADRRAERRPEKKRRKQGEIHLLGGLAAGLVGGIVATWVLDMYQQGALEATRRAENAVGAGPVLSRHQEEQMRSQERAHVETAQRIVKSTIGKGLNRSQRRDAAPVVHYAIGALAGGAYGLAAELIPAVRTGYGTGYASLLFTGSSQTLIPGFGFGPQKKDGDGLSGHLVYGATLETARRILRSVL
jgi:F0F1-type ATP synthase assembly protein I